MARAGLGSSWSCLFANDFDESKAAIYRKNWGDGELVVGDVRMLETNTFPGKPDLVWGSFPCQDLSLAGNGAGLSGERSGTFWPLLDHVRKLRRDGRGPTLLVLENVYGTLRSHQGKDFQAIAEALSSEGFRFGAMIVDASLFLPQSRPRLFVIAVHEGANIPEKLLDLGANETWHPKALRESWKALGTKVKRNWVWWNLPKPPLRRTSFSDLIEATPSGVRWHSPEDTSKLMNMMAPLHRKKVQAAKLSGTLQIGTIYKRTRVDSEGNRAQRAEVRFDEIAGCLRTPAGGSSRQIILVVEGKSVRSRLISARETARLMGLPDTYQLPENYNEAYHLTGDGVVVPVVRHLSRFLLEPILIANRFFNRSKAA